MCNNTLHHMAQQREGQQKLVAHEPGNLHKFVISNLDFSQFVCLLLLQLFRFIHIPNSVWGGKLFRHLCNSFGGKESEELKIQNPLMNGNGELLLFSIMHSGLLSMPVGLIRDIREISPTTTELSCCISGTMQTHRTSYTMQESSSSR